MATANNLGDSRLSSESEQKIHLIMNIDTIIWVDAEANIESEKQQAQQQLQRVFSDIEIRSFEEISACEEYVRQNIGKSSLLIVSSQFSETLTRKMHELDDIKSIYICDYGRHSNTTWMSNFVKVRGIFNQLSQIVNKIQLDQKQLEQSQQYASDCVFSFNHEGDSSLIIDGDILQFRQILDFLHIMDWTDNDYDEFVEYWTKKWSENPSNMNILHEFIDSYSIDQVFYWYTRQTFIYAALNKALRQQNIDVLLHMRFFINNIYHQLATLQKDQPTIPARVYRGQLLSNDELILWKKSFNRSILMKSFFSTTSNRDLAVFILGDTERQSERWYGQSTSSLKRVLFVIDTGLSSSNGDMPFANISIKSYFPEEEETLFMAGCIFRMSGFDYDEKENIHLIMLELCNINEEIKSVLAEKKKHFGNDHSLITLGHMLEEAGQLDLAETCYQNELNKMSTWENYRFDERNIAVCYHSLGNIAQRKKDYEKSLDWYEKALKQNELLLPPNHDLIADCYRSIGSMHGKLENTDQALDCLEIALAMFTTNHGELNPRVASCLHDIGSAYLHRSIKDKNTDYSIALNYLERALDIKDQTLSKNHPDRATTLFNIASLYRISGQLDKALSHYKHSLEIKLKSFPELHPCVIDNYYSIAAVCREKNDHEGAAEYDQLAKRSEANFCRLKYPDAIAIQIRTPEQPIDDTDD